MKAAGADAEIGGRPIDLLAQSNRAMARAGVQGAGTRRGGASQQFFDSPPRLGNQLVG